MSFALLQGVDQGRKVLCPMVYAENAGIAPRSQLHLAKIINAIVEVCVALGLPWRKRDRSHIHALIKYEGECGQGEGGRPKVPN